MSPELFSLDGRVALVTGASRGLGAAIATALARAGADVAAHGNAAPAEATCQRVRAFGRQAVALVADMADPAAPGRLVQEAVAAFGHLDIVVNNAGIIRRGPTVETSDDDWHAVMDVNLHGVFRMCRSAGRHMLTGGRGGKIINIASLLSFQGGLNVPAYAASKSAVAGLTRELSNEWAGQGINVNAIAPGYMRTDNTKALQNDETRNRQILERIPAGRWGDPSDLDGAVVFLASRASDYVNGHVLAVDGGWLGR
ncbi:MAG TPA: 2-dehydro-3-deoxy-D-gluconate 5-dehydrogenase KduD [Vicinamibacterales bacterium]|nr:2-dehydro-3-deoxy-D-gluconate 5-dehydrogenase KduD [Vicinamibacterales bacterium]